MFSGFTTIRKEDIQRILKEFKMDSLLELADTISFGHITSLEAAKAEAEIKAAKAETEIANLKAEIEKNRADKAEERLKSFSNKD
jgi:(p)ppGpp synthase/HD superfamily hydrolase